VPRPVTIPAGAKSVELRSFITGTARATSSNCAEFCQRNHAFKVGDMRVSRLVWRADCATTSAPGQAGNFRLVACRLVPGADVPPWVADVTAAARGATTVSYEVDPYGQHLRPDSATARGCSLGTGCALRQRAPNNHNPNVSALGAVFAAS
jgi:hypothetical protein